MPQGVAPEGLSGSYIPHSWAWFSHHKLCYHLYLNLFVYAIHSLYKEEGENKKKRLR